MTPRVFKAFLYHAEFKKIKSNWTIAQTNGYYFLQNWKSERFTSIVTMETDDISCTWTFLSQYIKGRLIILQLSIQSINSIEDVMSYEITRLRFEYAIFAFKYERILGFCHF